MISHEKLNIINHYINTHYGILWPRFLFQDTVGIMMGLRGEVPVDAEERSKVPQNTIW